MTKQSIGIGIIGAGFLAETRARCYRRVSGYDVALVAVAARTEARAAGYAERHRVAFHTTNYREVLARADVDLVDLCVPNALHRPLAEAAAAAGKHIVCTKPLTAYVGQDLPPEATDEQIAGTDPGRMLAVAVQDAQAMLDAADRAGVQLLYGENWIYAPSVRKAERLMAAAEGTILEMRGGECHKGSHSAYSKKWRYTGGGALLRLGAHPIGAMLYLKRQEGMRRLGRPIRPVSVTAEVADLSRTPGADRRKLWIGTGWHDVENWAAALITFGDGTRGVVHASDAVLGGMESGLEIFLSNSQFKCHLSPNNLLQAYAPDREVFGDEYIMEKVDSGAGWSTPMPDEDWTSGHLAMCEEFVGAVAEHRPIGSEAALGVDVIRTIYSAYRSAATGRREQLAD
jgi:predicted dehydrogenase